MKADIHPKYYPNATFTCACGAVFTMGSVKENVHVEICSKCHPFYTGNEKVIDTAGRVEKFKARQANAATVSAGIKAGVKAGAKTGSKSKK